MAYPIVVAVYVLDIFDPGRILHPPIPLALLGELLARRDVRERLRLLQPGADVPAPRYCNRD